jgi:hypothetical protein
MMAKFVKLRWDPMRADAACCVEVIRGLRQSWKSVRDGSEPGVYSISAECGSCGKEWTMTADGVAITITEAQ